MRFNKTVAKSMVFAMALGMLPFANVGTAKAAVTAEFNNKTGMMTLSAANTFWGIAKPLKAKDKKKANVVVAGKYYKVTNVEPYMAGIDVAAFGYGKNIFIAYGEKDELNNDGQYADWGVQEIKAPDKNFKAVYIGTVDGKIGKVSKAASALGGVYGYFAAEETDATDATGKKVVELSLATKKDKVEVQIGDGPWTKFNGFVKTADSAGVSAKLKGLIQKGSSLKFRYADSDTQWYKESKVKVSTQPNAPKIGVDVAKDQITGLKKDMQYGIIESTATLDTVSWKTATDKQKTADIAATLGAAVDGTKKYHLFAKTPPAKKKVVSKLSKILLNAQAAPTLDGSGTYENAPNYTLITSAVTIELDKKFDENGGATLINDSTDDYEYFVNGAAITALPDKAKWATLKGKKDASAKPTKVKIKYSNKGNKPNTYAGATTFTVLLRKPGKKLKNGEATLASAPAKAEVTFKKIAQATTIAGASPVTVDNSANTVAVNYTAGETFEGTFTYTVANYQKFDKKPKLEVAKKTPGVTLKVDKFEESGVATVTFRLDKKATDASVVQKLKLSAEGAEPREITITFTKTP